MSLTRKYEEHDRAMPTMRTHHANGGKHRTCIPAGFAVTGVYKQCTDITLSVYLPSGTADDQSGFHGRLVVSKAGRAVFFTFTKFDQCRFGAAVIEHRWFMYPDGRCGSFKQPARYLIASRIIFHRGKGH